MTEIDTPSHPAARAGSVLLPLDRLRAGSDNVRRTDRKAEIEALAADIAAHGLLQNLVVTQQDEGAYGVEAGGRRLAALQLLARRRQIAHDHAVPCVIVSAADAHEISLAENVQRVAMNPMDEAEAFLRRLEAGDSIEDVARRFGRTVRHVEQRRALGRLSDKVRSAFRKGQVSLEAARAFCVVDDHRLQDRVLRQLGRPVTNAHAVRRALTQGRAGLDDRLARFVGVDAYRAAGGRITEDLFEDGAWLDDSDLLARLAGDRLEALRMQVASEGWGWVEANADGGAPDGLASERVHPRQRRLKPAEKQALAEAQARVHALDAVLAESEDENDPRWDERDAAVSDLRARQRAGEVWDARETALAGAVIRIGHDGSPMIDRGLVRRKDRRALTKLQEAGRNPGPDSGPQDDAVGRAPAGLSRALTRELAQARSRALQQRILHDPHVALALLVHALAQASLMQRPVAGLGVAVRVADKDEAAHAAQQRATLAEALGGSADEALAALLERPDDALLGALALFVAEIVDLTHEGATPQDATIQALGDRLASALGLDMSRAWRPDRTFFERAPKAVAMAALEAATGFIHLSDKQQSEQRAAWLRMKRSERAEAAARACARSGWLPDMLVTPPASGVFDITPSGEAALASSAG